MVAYNTVPLSEDARLNEPKAPQNPKALIALVAAVCLQYLLREEKGTRNVHQYRNKGNMWNDRGHYGQHGLLKYL